MMDVHALPNPEPGEELRLVMRRHFIDVVRIFLLVVSLLFVPTAIAIVVALKQGASVLDEPFWGPALLVILTIYLLITFGITLTQITDYWLDVWIVTTERIISTEQNGLFNRVVSELHHDQIQDITSEQVGFLGTMLTFGNVYIQTAGERERFVFKNIDNPDDVKIAISKLRETCAGTHHHSRTPSI